MYNFTPTQSSQSLRYDTTRNLVALWCCYKQLMARYLEPDEATGLHADSHVTPAGSRPWSQSTNPGAKGDNRRFVEQT